ncbi:MAG: HPr family phosphocarrier protein [Alphaproteobacteria bacterium]|nr:HPr family phosphocarrier protein [Alphaproteobacteria bacterium]
MSVQKELEIKNRKGLHARAAAAFVKIVEAYDAEITVGRAGVIVSGCSIMGLMMLAASQGSKITVCAEGNEADEALQAISKLIEDKFGEE